MRSALIIFLAFSYLTNGFAMVATPEWWYATLPGVSHTGAMNSHFIRDIGFIYLLSGAAAVIALRKQRGGFKSIEELKDVKGIGDAGLQKMRPFVRLEGKTTARRP